MTKYFYFWTIDIVVLREGFNPPLAEKRNDLLNEKVDAPTNQATESPLGKFNSKSKLQIEKQKKNRKKEAKKEEEGMQKERKT